MGVIDVFMGQPGMQQRLDRRVRPGGINQRRPLDIHHIFVRQRIQRPQPQQHIHSHSRQASRLNIAQIPSRPFDMNHRQRVTVDIGQRLLHRGIAAAMHHQIRVLANDPR